MAKASKAAAKKAKTKKGAAKKAAPKRVARPKRHLLKKLTAASFEPFVGTVFTTSCFGGRGDDGLDVPGKQVEIKLIACELTAEKVGVVLPKGPAIAKRKSFRIVFQGPDYFPFPNDSYDLSHPEMGEIEGIHMSPDFGPHGVKSYLTANFN